MHWWQKVLFWLSRFTLRAAVLLAVTTAVLVALVGSPDTVQTFVKNSGAYDTFVNSILDESAKLDESENTVPVNDPEIRELANNTFTPPKLEEYFNEITNGIYRWLNGEVPQPDYQIDLADEKEAIATGVSQHAKQRVAALPACTQLPDTTDPFELDCRPPGIDLDAEAAKIKAELLSSDGFLEDTTITFSDMEDVDQEGLQGTADAFQTLKRLPVILSVLAAIAAAGVVLLAKTRRSGFNRVARSLLSSGLFLAITTLVFGKLLPAISPSLKARFNDGSFAGIFNSVFWQAVDLVVRETLIYSGIVIGIAAVIFIALRLTKPKNKIIRPQKASLKV